MCRWTASAAAGLLLAACAEMPSLPPAVGEPDALAYWDSAVRASAEEHEAMWMEAQFDGALWRIALLQSLPQTSHYRPGVARERLSGALQAEPPADVAAVMRLRLAELDGQRRCEVRTDQLQQQLDQLQQRLDRIIEIEKRFDARAR